MARRKKARKSTQRRKTRKKARRVVHHRKTRKKSRKKARSHKGKIPLAILQRRAAKLIRLVKSRGGKVY